MRRAAALLITASIVLAACGGDDDDDAAPDDTTSTTEVVEEGTTTTTEADDDGDETTTTTEAPASDEVTALEIYAREILRWPDATLEGTAVQHELVVRSPTFGEAQVSMAGDDATGWHVESLFMPMADDTASVKLGFADDNSVSMGYRDAALTPDLTIDYGDGFANVYVRGGEPGGAASWPVELDPTLDNGPRRVTVMWRDADGAARAATVIPVPAGEFAAG
jgi:hypothetical protein